MDTSSWKWFKYNEIFKIKKGFFNKKPDEDFDGDIPFIGATDSNNGVTSMHNIETIESTSKAENTPNVSIENKIFKAPCITVSNNGSVGYAFYQTNNFTCTHDINPLYLKNRNFTPYIALFLCTIIECDRFRWTYGRKWRPIRMPNSLIKLPQTNEGKPDWDFMENYIRNTILPQLPPKSHNIWISI